MQDMAYGDSPSGGRIAGLRGWIAAATKWGGALLSLLLVVSLVVWAYSLGTRDARDVPVIKAMSGPTRVVPTDPGGEIAAHQGLEVNEILAGGEAGIPDAAELAPPPDALAETDQAAGNLPPIEELSDQRIASVGAPVTDGDVIVEPGGEVAGGPPRTAERPEPRPANLATIQSSPNTASGANSNGSGEASENQVAPGTRTVQLGAFDSPGDARSQWDRLQRDHADLLGNRSNYVQRADSNGSTFFRLRVLGFDAASEQNSLCEALKARSVECIAVTVR